MEGYEKNEICNRDGCNGVIEEKDTDGGCSCHINPPCGYCTTNKEYCPVCEWDGEEEQMEYEKVQLESYNKNKEYYAEQNRKFSEARELFYKKYRGEVPTDKFECRTESHTHFSMKVVGVFPCGFDLSTVMDRIRGTFGGRFTRRGETSFEYIAYTD
jgi:hypothetical protein